ncbi:MAG: MOSC domain-containing protein [Flavobacteriales bacterium]|nr:MOSC domain-containing protein [Flavobacteriales bacterium]
MKVLSVNKSISTEITVNGKTEYTGYFKNPVDQIYLSKSGVQDDFVADLVHHGGEDKACYLFGFNHYTFWQTQYPDIPFKNGAFGENITLDFLDESQLKIGDIIQIGEAKIQISQPRQPCYKMGIKFNDPKIVNNYRLSHTPGIYVRVLSEGWVKTSDAATVIESNVNSPTVLETFELIYQEQPDNTKLNSIINNEFVAQRLKNYLKGKFNIV